MATTPNKTSVPAKFANEGRLSRRLEAQFFGAFDHLLGKIGKSDFTALHETNTLNKVFSRAIAPENLLLIGGR